MWKHVSEIPCVSMKESERMRICAKMNARHYHVNLISCHFHIKSIICIWMHVNVSSFFFLALYLCDLSPHLICLQIPPLPPHCPRTPRHAHLLAQHYPGPWLWSAETAAERPGSTVACAEPGSTTRWWPSNTTRARNTAGTQPGPASWSS